MTIEEKELLDGRRARRAGNRRRMLLAGLNLMKRSGSYRVSPPDVTDACDLHQRSFNMIFGDLDGFYTALIEDYSVTLTDMINTDVRTRKKTLMQLILLGK